MSKVLLCDDEPGVLFTLKEVLEERGHQVVSTTSGKTALERLEGIDAALIDYSMPEMDGLALLSAIRERDDSIPVLLLTAHGSERVAVAAMKAGAHDYLSKPFDIDEVAIAIERAIEVRRLRTQNKRLEAERAIGKAIVAESPPMKRLLDAVSRVAPKDVTVLVRGETGTGKEMIGSLLHAQSRRSKGPLIRFNCAAIPAELAESELFGHTKGAFTGAQNAQRGFFAQAHGGTLILDEVGEIPIGLQAKLLRAIQEGEIQPVGSGRVEKVDVRIVASTNRDLLTEARAGKFREDLYYRLAVVELIVPPLDQRKEDIAALAESFARRYGDKFDVEVSLAPALVSGLVKRSWPGNVRELENTVARLVALSPGGVIDEPVPDVGATPSLTPEGGSLKEQVESFEKSLIAKAMSDAHNNQSEAARKLGLSRGTLIDKLKKYGLS